MSKITKATFKSFLRKNPNFMLRVKSSFDGMTDCVQSHEGDFVRPSPATYPCDNNLGYHGVWLVGSGRDRFYDYNQNGRKGIEVYNCCGSFIVVA